MSTTTFERTYSRASEETPASIKRHISKLYGFKQKSIQLLEADFDSFFYADTTYHYCVYVAFCVNGIGYETDFMTLEMNDAYNL